MFRMEIIGRLGGDAEVKQINGQAVLNFSVAYSYKYKDSQGNQKENTYWVRCDYWLKSAALAQYLTKGTMIYVSGIPRAYAYQKEDRTIQANLQLRVHDLQLLGSNKREDTNAAGNTHEPPPPAPAADAGPVDDLPF